MKRSAALDLGLEFKAGNPAVAGTASSVGKRGLSAAAYAEFNRLGRELLGRRLKAVRRERLTALPTVMFKLAGARTKRKASP